MKMQQCRDEALEFAVPPLLPFGVCPQLKAGDVARSAPVPGRSNVEMSCGPRRTEARAPSIVAAPGDGRTPPPKADPLRFGPFFHCSVASMLRWLSLPLFLALGGSCLSQPGLPVITNGPQSQTVTQGASASFSVGVRSLTYLTYQWRFFGTNLAGATDSALKLMNVQVWQAGPYSVVVSNSYGPATSTNAILTVALPPGTASTWGDNTSGQSTVPSSSNFFATQSFNTPGSPAPNEPDHCGYPPCGSYWLTYTPPLSGTLTVDSIGTTFNAILDVYAGTDLSNLQPVACSANHGSAGESVTFPATGGAMYFVFIEGVNCVTGPATINFNLLVSFGFGVKAIAAGGGHSLVLKTNGVVLGWGDNSFGQATPPAGLNQVVAIAAGHNHSLALRTDGSVVAWGDNSLEQTNVPPEATNVIKIAAGAAHNLALRGDGTVAAWGADSDGQTDVPVTLSNVVLIAAGNHHSLAWTRDGELVGWGSFFHGETMAPPGLSGVVSLSAGDGFSLALKANGTVVVWGDNSFGQTNVPTTLTGVAAISAGDYHCLVLRNNGAVAAWGQDISGQTNVPFVISRIVAVSAGASHSMTLAGSGAPVILTQPLTKQVDPGATASFAAMAVGDEAPGYQWRLNGVNLAGATGNVLTRTNVQLADAGNYSVLVSNSLDTVLSADAALVVGSYPFLSPVGFTQDGFKLRVVGPGGLYTFQASADFFSWMPLATTNAPPGTVVFSDPTAAGFARRFYRVLVQ